MTKLTARRTETAQPGKYSDGNNLYLVVRKGPSGSLSRKWVFRFTWRGAAKEMGLGSIKQVSLQTARQRAVDALRTLGRGENPIESRRRDSAIPTFGAMADQTIQTLCANFRNEKHKAQWRMTLEVYAAELRPLRVDKVTTGDVLGVLKAIWQEKPETACRLRGRIEKVLDAAKARGFRHDENPARWRGQLEHLLPKPSKLRRGHHAAMPYEDIPAFITRLRDRQATAALALELCILTAARSGEILGMRWSEVDLEKKTWIVPASRMKSGKEHRVPLSSRAVSILKLLAAARTSDLVFEGQRQTKPLSNMAMSMILRRMKIANATVHGFRSTFRDWVEDVSSFPPALAEAALAHIKGDKTERAYRRKDALEKRQALMEAWANHCGSQCPSENSDSGTRRAASRLRFPHQAA